MRLATLLSTALLASPLLATPGFAQNAAPLTYVQPLTPQSIQAVQDRLRQAGTYSGAVDGVWGPDSAAALQQYQQAHQLQVTGQMNQATAATLGIDPTTLLSPAAPAQAAAQSPPPPGATLRPSSIRTVQSRLRALNFYTGAVDGVWGQSTQTAIERFQQGRGLQPNGQLNPATIVALGLTPDMLSYR